MLEMTSIFHTPPINFHYSLDYILNFLDNNLT